MSYRREIYSSPYRRKESYAPSVSSSNRYTSSFSGSKYNSYDSRQAQSSHAAYGTTESRYPSPSVSSLATRETNGMNDGSMSRPPKHEEIPPTYSSNRDYHSSPRRRMPTQYDPYDRKSYSRLDADRSNSTYHRPADNISSKGFLDMHRDSNALPRYDGRSVYGDERSAYPSEGRRRYENERDEYRRDERREWREDSRFDRRRDERRYEGSAYYDRPRDPQYDDRSYGYGRNHYEGDSRAVDHYRERDYRYSDMTARREYGSVSDYPPRQREEERYGQRRYEADSPSAYSSKPQHPPSSNNPQTEPPSIHDDSSPIHAMETSTQRWQNEDIITVLKEQKSPVIGIAILAAASLILDPVKSVSGFKTAAKVINDMIEINTADAMYSKIMKPAIQRKSGFMQTHVAYSFVAVKNHMKLELAKEFSRQSVEKNVENDTPLEMKQFYARCGLLVATAMLKSSPTCIQLTLEATEAILNHGFNIAPDEDWLNTSQSVLYVVSDEVRDVILNSPDGTDKLASVATVALMSEGSKCLALERIRINERKLETMKIGGHKEKSPSLTDEEERNVIRRKGSLMDGVSKSDDDDHDEKMKYAKSSYHRHVSYVPMQKSPSTVAKNKDMARMVNKILAESKDGDDGLTRRDKYVQRRKDLRKQIAASKSDDTTLSGGDHTRDGTISKDIEVAKSEDIEVTKSEDTNETGTKSEDTNETGTSVFQRLKSKLWKSSSDKNLGKTTKSTMRDTSMPSSSKPNTRIENEASSVRRNSTGGKRNEVNTGNKSKIASRNLPPKSSRKEEEEPLREERSKTVKGKGKDSHHVRNVSKEVDISRKEEQLIQKSKVKKKVEETSRPVVIKDESSVFDFNPPPAVTQESAVQTRKRLKNRELEKRREEITMRISRIQGRAHAERDMPSILGQVSQMEDGIIQGQYPNTTSRQINRPSLVPNEQRQHPSLIETIVQTLGCAVSDLDGDFEEYVSDDEEGFEFRPTAVRAYPESKTSPTKETVNNEQSVDDEWKKFCQSEMSHSNPVVPNSTSQEQTWENLGEEQINELPITHSFDMRSNPQQESQNTPKTTSEGSTLPYQIAPPLVNSASNVSAGGFAAAFEDASRTGSPPRRAKLATTSAKYQRSRREF